MCGRSWMRGDGVSNLWNSVVDSPRAADSPPISLVYPRSPFSIWAFHWSVMSLNSGEWPVRHSAGQRVSQGQTYNLLLIGSFVFSGFTAYLLAYAMTGTYAGSLLAGALFTVCEYHSRMLRAILIWFPTQGIPLRFLPGLDPLAPTPRFALDGSCRRGGTLGSIFGLLLFFLLRLDGSILRGHGTQDGKMAALEVTLRGSGAALGGALIIAAGAPVFLDCVNSETLRLSSGHIPRPYTRWTRWRLLFPAAIGASHPGRPSSGRAGRAIRTKAAFMWDGTFCFCSLMDGGGDGC